MPLVTIFSASHCGAGEVAREAARRLGWDLVGPEVLERAAREAGITVARLRETLAGAPLFRLHPRRERARRVAHLRLAAARVLAREDLVYHGFAGLLVPREVTHVLRVCLLADREFRLARARAAGAVSERRARRALDRTDLARAEWTRFLFRLGPWDRRLHDLRIPMQETTVEEAARLIEECASRPALRATPASREAMEDFGTAAAVEVALLEEGIVAETASKGGVVTVTVEPSAGRSHAARERIRRVASSVPGVASAEVRVRPRPAQTAFFREEEFQVPTRVLLVDDEKEFVLALSERLEIRRIEPSVAYDGEEALAALEERRPRVIVLDLRMPGMDGMEVLRRVKRSHPEVEVIILTGHGSEKDRALADELGAFAYLQKPVEIDELERTVREADEKARREGSPPGTEETED